MAPDPTRRKRADILLTERGLAESRARAQAAIAAGLVFCDGVAVSRASQLLPADGTITAGKEHPYVSRGGVKLAAALDHFGLSPRGLHCFDCGASTGGFTDVLLRRGAASVAAVDSGKGQLHVSLRADGLITLFEGADVRTFDVARLERQPAFIVCDVSFISVLLVLPALTRIASPDAVIIVLAKPQFEVGREAVGKGGIVKDAAATASALQRITACMDGLGWEGIGLMDSPIAGGDGNAEFLIAARRSGSGNRGA